MTYGGEATKRSGGLVKAISVVFEKLGLLNPGSAQASAVPDRADAERVGPIASNALNVTRVGGVAALISGAGGAALAIFSVDKHTDPTAVVVAAYASVGAIVAAALIAVAVIIAADIRARKEIAVATPAPSAGSATQASDLQSATRAQADGGDTFVIAAVPPDGQIIELMRIGGSSG